MAWIALTLAFLHPLHAQAQTQQSGPAAQAETRVWTNQSGRSLTARLISSQDDSVILELANGSHSVVPLAALSSPDQTYVRQWSSAHGVRGPAPSTDALAWPVAVSINPKDITVTPGEQNAGQRQYEYLTEHFRFVSNAALTGTVMKEVAADFELVRQVVIAMPWGWTPHPQKGSRFLIYLTETIDDYIALGGNDTSGAGSKDDYAFIKFSVLGLKKVGPRYAYDTREKGEGEVVGVTLRLMMGDMRAPACGWSLQGMEELVRTVAYHKNGFRFSNLGSAMKARIQEQARLGVEPDLNRMIEFLHLPRSAQRSDVKLIRQQNYFDGMLLVYYFGFLADDSKGTALHQYYRRLAKTAQGPRLGASDAGARAEALLGELLAGRTDDQLKADMTARFKASLNLKLVK